MTPPGESLAFARPALTKEAKKRALLRKARIISRNHVKVRNMNISVDFTISHASLLQKNKSIHVVLRNAKGRSGKADSGVRRKIRMPSNLVTIIKLDFKTRALKELTAHGFKKINSLRQ